MGPTVCPSSLSIHTVIFRQDQHLVLIHIHTVRFKKGPTFSPNHLALTLLVLRWDQHLVLVHLSFTLLVWSQNKHLLLIHLAFTLSVLKRDKQLVMVYLALTLSVLRLNLKIEHFWRVYKMYKCIKTAAAFPSSQLQTKMSCKEMMFLTALLNCNGPQPARYEHSVFL